MLKRLRELVEHGSEGRSEGGERGIFVVGYFHSVACSHWFFQLYQPQL